MPAQPRSETLLSRRISSPVGNLHVFVSARGLRAVSWSAQSDELLSGVAGHEIDEGAGASELLDGVERQLGEYFAGRRRAFELPLDPVGTPFQLSAWKVLCTIPYAETISYADQARTLGDVNKARAVGGANGRNPIPIVVPCHRVIGADGSLTGFAAGTDIKKFLLELERTHA